MVAALDGGGHVLAQLDDPSVDECARGVAVVDDEARRVQLLLLALARGVQRQLQVFAVEIECPGCGPVVIGGFGEELALDVVEDAPEDE